MLWTKKKDKKAGTTLIGLCYNGRASLGTDFDPEKPDGDELSKIDVLGDALVGFTGNAACAVILELFSEKYADCNNLEISAKHLADLWKKDEKLASFKGSLVAMNTNCVFLISPGEVKKIESGVVAVGPGQEYALAAIRAILAQPDVRENVERIVSKAFDVAAGVCAMVNRGAKIFTIPQGS